MVLVRAMSRGWVFYWLGGVGWRRRGQGECDVTVIVGVGMGFGELADDDSLSFEIFGCRGA